MNINIRDVYQHLNYLADLCGYGQLEADISFLTIKFDDLDQFRNVIKESEKMPNEIKDYLKLDELEASDEEWSLNFNKQGLFKNGIFFFVSESSFLSWLEDYTLFESSLLNRPGRKIILVKGLPELFIGPKLLLIPLNNSFKEIPNPPELHLPKSALIKEHIHFLGPNLEIEPSEFALSKYPENQIGHRLLEYSCKLLSLCLVQDVLSSNEIRVKGLKTLNLELMNSEMSFSELLSLHNNLIQVIRWVYEERVQTRLKLVSNRLSLDLLPSESLIFGLSKHLENAFEEAKEKYGFIIKDLSDEFDKEVRLLQTQIFDRAKNYGEKLRSLLASLLRDIIAAIFLVGFSVLSKSNNLDVTKFLTNEGIQILFRGLSIYFLASIALQVIFNISDILLTRAELFRFAKSTRSYLREDQIKKKINDLLGDREMMFGVLYFVITLCYLLMAYLCWNLKYVLPLVGIL